VNCPNCDKIIQGGASICPWCGVLVTNSDAGVVASAGKRLAGYLVGVAVWIFIWFIITTMIVVGSAETDNFGLAVLGIILLLVTIVYYFILLSRGKSYGKWILGMKVFRTSGEPAGFWIMLVRETIGKLISGLVFSLGYLWLLWDKDRQTWHDKLVSTVVMVPDKN